jgi:hypothetical protein
MRRAGNGRRPSAPRRLRRDPRPHHRAVGHRVPSPPLRTRAGGTVRHCSPRQPHGGGPRRGPRGRAAGRAGRPGAAVPCPGSARTQPAGSELPARFPELAVSRQAEKPHPVGRPARPGGGLPGGVDHRLRPCPGAEGHSLLLMVQPRVPGQAQEPVFLGELQRPSRRGEPGRHSHPGGPPEPEPGRHHRHRALGSRERRHGAASSRGRVDPVAVRRAAGFPVRIPAQAAGVLDPAAHAGRS